jgi:hypothetical protein
MNLIIHTITLISCVFIVSKHSISRYAAMFRLVLGSQISDGLLNIVATLEHPKLGTLFNIVLAFHSFLGG